MSPRRERRGECMAVTHRLVALEMGQTALMQQLAQMGAELQVTHGARRRTLRPACRLGMLRHGLSFLGRTRVYLPRSRRLHMVHTLTGMDVMYSTGGASPWRRRSRRSGL